MANFILSGFTAGMLPGKYLVRHEGRSSESAFKAFSFQEMKGNNPTCAEFPLLHI